MASPHCAGGRRFEVRARIAVRHLAVAALLAVGLWAFAAPSAVAATPSTASIARLSRTLANYAASFGSRVGISVLDVTRGTRYSYDPGGRFITASTVKVALAMAEYARVRQSGVGLTAWQSAEMAAMIEWSDNDAASYFYARVGGATGLARYLASIGVVGWRPYPNHTSWWGYSSLTAVTARQILERLWDGAARITATARARILYLMRHVAASQRWGVGDTAPAGSVVAVKNGWVVGPDGSWAVNTTGIVRAPGHTWIVAIYTRHDASYSIGVAIVRRIASLVARGVLAH